LAVTLGCVQIIVGGGDVSQWGDKTTFPYFIQARRGISGILESLSSCGYAILVNQKI
jgi:hypothetical protein